MVGRPPVNLQIFQEALLAEAGQCLMADEVFMRSENVREQCAHACRVLRENHQPVVPFSVIGRLLGLDKSTVRKEWKLWTMGRTNALSPGRHALLNIEMRAEIASWIEEKWSAHQPATHRQLRLFVSEKWGISILPNTMSHIVRNIPEIRSCVASPMEAERMNVPDEEISAWFRKLQESIDGVPAHFVFNMDEMGHQDYADAKDKVCIRICGIFFYQLA
jgi:hypothetical protein